VILFVMRVHRKPRYYRKKGRRFASGGELIKLDFQGKVLQKTECGIPGLSLHAVTEGFSVLPGCVAQARAARGLEWFLHGRRQEENYA
jgi:hypothetical protein